MQEKGPLKEFLENYVFGRQPDRRSITGQKYNFQKQVVSKPRRWLHYWPIPAIICSVIIASGVYLVIIVGRSQTINQNYEESPANSVTANEDEKSADYSGITQEHTTGSNLEQRLQKKVTFEFRNTPIENALTSISNTVGAKIVVSPEVTGTVTANITDMPAKEALNIVLAENGCGYVIDNDMIKIAPTDEIIETAGFDPSSRYSTTITTPTRGMMVTGIICSKDCPSALVGSQLVHEGDKVSGVTVVKINRESVEFEKSGIRWTQAVRQAPASYWE